MNAQQAVWYKQVCADHAVLLLLRREGALPCHQLHYLQMVTEKLGKAYFWRTGRPPRKSHASFVRFMQALDDRAGADRSRIAALFGFARADDFENWIPTITPLAYELERLAPALAGSKGPNPEYPWPWDAPIHAPASHGFTVWTKFTESGRGRQLLKVIDSAVLEFQKIRLSDSASERCNKGACRCASLRERTGQAMRNIRPASYQTGRGASTRGSMRRTT